MIKVILWDIDATLLNFKMAEKYSLWHCFKLFGLGECTDEMLERYSGINHGYWKRLERGEVTREQVMHGRFRDFFHAEGIVCGVEKESESLPGENDKSVCICGITDKVTEKRLNGSVEEFNHQYQLGLGDQVFFNDNGYDLVKRLRGNYKQYVVTNGSLVAQERKLKKSGLGDLMDGAFISEQIGAEKPSMEFFNKVWETIGPYKKDEVVIIGDSLTSDMQGGNNAGIKCIWYNPDGNENRSGCRIDYEIQSLEQVEEILVS